MEDTLRNLTFGIVAFFIFNSHLQKRVEHDAARQVREAFEETGPVQARVDSGGLFGLVTNHLSTVDIYGQHLRSQHLPFYLYPRSGWKGSIRHLRLHFEDFTLAGLPVERFDADIPDATYDLGHALYRHRLLLRSAGEGPARVVVGVRGLRLFITNKFQSTLSDVEVKFTNQHLLLTGKVGLLNMFLSLSATGKLVAREGRYVDLIEPDFRLDNKPLSAAFTNSLLKKINPVLDTVQDLGLGGFFILQEVEVGEDTLTIRGRVTIPIAAQAQSGP